MIDLMSKKKLFQRGKLVMVLNTRLGKMLGILKLKWVGPYWIFKECGPTPFYLADLMGRVLSA